MSKDKKKLRAQAASGMSREEDRAAASPPPKDVPPLWTRVFVWCVLGAAGILALWGLMLATGQAAEISRFAEQGWGQYAAVIVDNKIRAVWHAAFMTAVAGAGLWWMVGRRGQGSEIRGQKDAKGATKDNYSGSVVRWQSSVVPLLLVFIVALDAWWLSRHYVKTMPMSSLAENPVIALLKKDMPEHRVALVSQDGFYNWWLTYLFPYHDIKTINITQMPRMPTDYKNFLGAVGRNPLRYWQLAGVGYVLAPVQAWTQIQQTPEWKKALDLVYSYDVAPAEAGVTVTPASPLKSGQHVVLRLTAPAPRFALIGSAEPCADDETLRRLGASDYPLFQNVLVSPADAQNWSELSQLDGSATGIVGTCSLVAYRSGRIELDIDAQQPGILRLADKYDADWKATVDGRSAGVHRVDFIFQGIFVPQGRHRVIAQYRLAIWPLYVQGAGLLIVLGAGVWLVVGKIRGR